jgi:hypothetical protein
VLIADGRSGRCARGGTVSATHPGSTRANAGRTDGEHGGSGADRFVHCDGGSVPSQVPRLVLLAPNSGGG